MIFISGEQKVVKYNPYNQVQNITLCNVFFVKKSWGVFENFCIKSKGYF